MCAGKCSMGINGCNAQKMHFVVLRTIFLNKAFATALFFKRFGVTSPGFGHASMPDTLDRVVTCDGF